MNRFRITVSVVLLLAAAGAARADPIAYPCDSVVLTGRAVNETFTPMPDPSDILGHGRIDFDVNVQRVIYGRESRKIVPARFIAHTRLNRYVNFVFVLRAAPDGRYDMIDGQVLAAGQTQAQLAPHCTMPER